MKLEDNGMRWWREYRYPMEPPPRRHVGGDGTILEVGMKIGTYDTKKRARVTKLENRAWQWCGVTYDEGDDTTTEYTKQCQNVFALRARGDRCPEQ